MFEEREGYPTMHGASPAVDRVDLDRRRRGLRAAEQLLERSTQLRHRQSAVEREEVFPDHFVLAQTPQILRATAPGDDVQVGVHDDDGAFDAREHGLEEQV